MDQKLKSNYAKKRIRETALTCFKENGFQSTSIKEICTKSGYSIGAFYHHFSSKGSILDDTYSEFDSQLSKELEKKKFKTATEGIIYIVTKQSEEISSTDFTLVSTLFKEQLSSGSKYILNRHRFEINQLVHFIDYGKSTGEFIPTCSSVEIANSIFRVSVGDIYIWCLQEGKSNLLSTVLYDVNLIIKSIVP